MIINYWKIEYLMYLIVLDVLNFLDILWNIYQFKNSKDNIYRHNNNIIAIWRQDL